MNVEALRKAWEKIEEHKRCGNCPLKNKSKLLLFKPQHPVNVMVITEGPNRIEGNEFIASLANHPTFTYLTALAGGRFTPEGKNANVYWTHVRKCFIRKNNRSLTNSPEKALEACQKSGYLIDEIKAVKPQLLLAVGKKAKDFLSKFNEEFRVKLEYVFSEQIRRRFKVEINGVIARVMFVPHPSGRSRFWGKPPKEAKEVLDVIRDNIESNLRSTRATNQKLLNNIEIQKYSNMSEELEKRLKEIVGKQVEVVATTIKTANSLLRDVKHLAIEEGATISEVVTKALKDYLEKEKRRGK